MNRWTIVNHTIFIDFRRERIREIMEKVKKKNPKLYRQIEKAERERSKEIVKEARNAERERAKKGKKNRA